MKIFHNEEIYIKTDNFSDSIFKENTMFFDIETTGFSPVKAIVYMIGCARRIKNRIVIDQYFAESVDDITAANSMDSNNPNWKLPGKRSDNE